MRNRYKVDGRVKLTEAEGISFLNHLRGYKPNEYNTERTDVLITNNPFNGKVVVVTGTLTNYTREGIQAKLFSLGAKPSSSISRATDYLIVGEKAGGKLDKVHRSQHQFLPVPYPMRRSSSVLGSEADTLDRTHHSRTPSRRRPSPHSNSATGEVQDKVHKSHRSQPPIHRHSEPCPDSGLEDKHPASSQCQSARRRSEYKQGFPHTRRPHCRDRRRSHTGSWPNSAPSPLWEADHNDTPHMRHHNRCLSRHRP